METRRVPWIAKSIISPIDRAKCVLKLQRYGATAYYSTECDLARNVVMILTAPLECYGDFMCGVIFVGRPHSWYMSRDVWVLVIPISQRVMLPTRVSQRRSRLPLRSPVRSALRS